jgi:hypothetical protein
MTDPRTCPPASGDWPMRVEILNRRLLSVENQPLTTQ